MQRPACSSIHTINGWKPTYHFKRLLSEYHGPVANAFPLKSHKENRDDICMRTPARGCRRYSWAVLQNDNTQFDLETLQFYIADYVEAFNRR